MTSPLQSPSILSPGAVDWSYREVPTKLPILFSLRPLFQGPLKHHLIYYHHLSLYVNGNFHRTNTPRLSQIPHARKSMVGLGTKRITKVGKGFPNLLCRPVSTVPLRSSTSNENTKWLQGKVTVVISYSSVREVYTGTLVLTVGCVETSRSTCTLRYNVGSLA